MKKVFVLLLVALTTTLVCFGCVNKLNEDNNSYLRIHIRANSNYEIDQYIKYLVKDNVIEFLTPLIVRCNSLNDVKNTLNVNLQNIKNLVDSFLQNNNFNYKSTVYLNNEFFPTRCYDGLVLKANYYDALIIELGSGTGDNWWCVVYPPLCFLNGNKAVDNNFVYKSKILELINKYL